MGKKTNGNFHCLRTVKGSKLDIVNPEKILAATLDTPTEMLCQCSLTIKTKPTNQTQISKNYWGRKTECDTLLHNKIIIRAIRQNCKVVGLEHFFSVVF